MKYLIGNSLYFIIIFYMFLLMARVLLSWINLPPNAFTMWICKLTDPVLDFFRKTFPIRFGVFDLSIIVPVAILLVLGKIVNEFMVLESYEPKMIINAWYLMGLLLYITDIIAGFIISLYIIITFIVLIFTLIGQNSAYNQAISYFYAIINPMKKYIGRFIKLKSPRHTEILSLVILLIILIALNILKTGVINELGQLINIQLLDTNINKTRAI